MPDQDDHIPFDRSLRAPPDDVQPVSGLVRRLIANNGGPYTFTGTCTYLVGHEAVAVIDPGPADPQHIDAILAATAGSPICAILVTHTHRDHAPAAEVLRQRTGAPVLGCAPYGPPVRPPGHDMPPSDAAHDLAYRPDRVLADGERFAGPGFDLFAIATPGHASNHLAFALPQEEALFSGDHVMAWSTTVVAPPDGSMRHYMASLDRLAVRADRVYWPGHGGPVHHPQRFVRALLHHRRQREHAILLRLQLGDTSIETLVARLYVDLAPALKGAAALSVLAHLEDLVARGLAMTSGPIGLKAHYFPV